MAVDAEATKRTGECTHCALVVASRDCEVEFADSRGREWLKVFFAPPRRAGRLPLRICTWLAADVPRKSLVVQRGQDRLFIRRFRPHPVNAIALLLERVSPGASSVGRKHGALTKREMEVLHWLAEGKSNPEIGIILKIAVGTVSKHLERAFQKLGVENRTAAAGGYLRNLAPV